MKKLKVGLLVDSEFATPFTYDLVRWAKDHPDIEVSHLVIHAPPDQSRAAKVAAVFRREGLGGVLSRVGLHLIERLERILLRRFGIKDADYDGDLRAFVPNVITISPQVSKSGLVYRFTAADIDQVRQEEFDVLIRCGSRILRGEILEASRLGVLSFHHGDNRVNRGGPPGFWECFYRWPNTGFIIQRLTNEMDGGEVLFRGSFGTKFLYLLNQVAIFRKSDPYLRAVLEGIAKSRNLPPAEQSIPYSNKIFRIPSIGVCALYVIKVAFRLTQRAIRGAFYKERWGLSLVNAPWKNAAFWRSHPARIPRGRFWADPFLWRHKNDLVCFVEDFDYSRKRGHITALRVDGTSFDELGVALSEPFHLSYPFLFQYRGDLFMCPESSEAGQIRIYRCEEFPLKWKFHHVAMNVPAADSTLFERGGRWWLLTNLDPSGMGDYGSALYLFSADNPLSSEWTPHPKNPIRVDARGGRNAGLLVEGDKIFRAAQIQGFDLYGYGTAIYEIEEVTTTNYRERLVSEILPTFRKKVIGTHHLSSDGSTTVIDHVSWTFMP